MNVRAALAILFALAVYFVGGVSSVLAAQPVVASKASQAQFNTPTPSLGPKVKALRAQLKDPKILALAKTDPAVKSLLVQVTNQLRHVSFSFKIRDNTYTHDLVIEAPYPRIPTLIAIQKAQEFLSFINAKATAPEKAADDPQLEQQLLDQQKDFIKKITAQPLATYLELRQRLQKQGANAKFQEFAPIVEFLKLKILSDATLIQLSEQNSTLNNYRASVIAKLNDLAKRGYPYMASVEGIQRSLEFYDIAMRVHDPSRSPKLYHSDRYEYYGAYLKGEIPDHIIMPTTVALGATDILKVRGVPLGFVGVNVDIEWVDGFFQTPYEFWIHDINHSRRMYQFFKEMAASLNLTIEQFARQSDSFVQNKIMPLIAIKKTDDDVTKNKKRLIKIILFEIFHEDALSATPEVVKNGILRPPNLITPFESMEGDEVTYVMEPGATTLAYAFRKLAHDFYDMPGDRIENIVAPAFRTRENIVEAAETIFKHLGFKVDREILNYFVSTDEGFPRDFKQTLKNDIANRPGETEPLDKVAPMSKKDIVAVVANDFHESWQERSGYLERWKPAAINFKDGRGVNDNYVMMSTQDLADYFSDREIPNELQKYYSIRISPETGRPALYEDIRHLAHKYLAPNNQFENIRGATEAVNLVESIFEKRLHFDSADQVVKWLRDANEKMNDQWLIRNGSWAKKDPVYNRTWANLPALKQRNGMDLMRLAFNAKFAVDPNFIEPSQRVLIQEGLRRLDLDVQTRARFEVRAELAGENLHSGWRSRAQYTERWKPSRATLDNGTLVNSPQLLGRYLTERKVPAIYHRYFNFEGAEMFEDILHLPYEYLSQAHQAENIESGKVAVSIVDRLWERPVRFSSVEQVKRWLQVAALSGHRQVLDRSGRLTDEMRAQTWESLGSAVKLNDLAVVKAAIDARLRYQPGSMSEEQRRLIMQGLRELEASLNTSCDELLKPAKDQP